MNSFFKGNHTVRREEFLPDFRGVTWITRAKADAAGLPTAKALYLDKEWACFGENLPNGVYYSMRFPLRYAGERSAPHE